MIEEFEVSLLERGDLLDLSGLFAVVRGVVFADLGARCGRCGGLLGDAMYDHARRVSLHGQMDQVEPLARLAHPFVSVEVGLVSHVGLRFGGPFLVLSQTLFGFAN